MKPEMAAEFDRHEDKVINWAVEVYGLSRDELVKLGGFESLVYEHEAADLILKISHSMRWAAASVQGGNL